MMKGQRLRVSASNHYTADRIITDGDRSENDINALASKDGDSVWIMIWNYLDDHIESEAASVWLSVNHVDEGSVLVQHYRIDDEFSNSFEKWKAMGKPQNVTEKEYMTLEKAGQLQLLTSPYWQEVRDGKAQFSLQMPLRGVSFIHLSW